MTKLSKKKKQIQEAESSVTLTSFNEIVTFLKQFASMRFDETVDLAVGLGIDTKHSDQMVRGSADLPHGDGKNKKVAVFVKEDLFEQAKAAGADKVGYHDLLEEIKSGKIDFDILVSAPNVMPELAKVGQILGPKGLMPNPKVGTVTLDIANVVMRLKKGQALFRADRYGIVHCSIGKLSFSPENLKENAASLVEEIRRLKPAKSKGEYFRQLVISSSMGPSVPFDLSYLN